MSDKNVCPLCKGKTVVPKYEGSDELVQCPACLGTGVESEKAPKAKRDKK